MFSGTLGKNVRSIDSKATAKSVMFSRIEEFARNYIVGGCVSDSIATTLESILNDRKPVAARDKLDGFILDSQTWLCDSVKEAK